MLNASLIQELATTEEFFLRTTSTLTAEDGQFRPKDDMYTVTGHLDHVAVTVTWFMEGAFIRPDGFDMNFEAHIEASMAATDFTAAMDKLKAAFAAARGLIAEKSDVDLMTPMVEGPIMGGAPRLAVIAGITDHTAHHRGALAVYARLLGKTAPMPYA